MNGTENERAAKTREDERSRKRKSRRRFWTVCIAIVVVVYLVASLQRCEGRKQLAALRSLRVEQLASATIYNYSGRNKKVLRVIDDPALLSPFVEAMNQLEDYSPQHPAYSVSWYVVLQFDDGRRIGLKCDLMHSPDRTVYVGLVSARWPFVLYLADAKSPMLYDWLVGHAWQQADLATINAIGGTFEHSSLHRAAMGGHIEIAQLLLDKGADINCRGQFGTPLDMAMRGDKKEMVSFLRQRGAMTTAELSD